MADGGVPLNGVSVTGGKLADTEQIRTIAGTPAETQRVKLVLGTLDTDGGDWGSGNPAPVSAISWPLPSGAATDASVTALQVSQGSTTSGQKGDLVQGAVTTGAPTYTTGQTSPLSLTATGALRVDASAATQPVSGTVTSNQGTAAATASAWPTKTTDGTNVAAVKAASTAAVATDPALVVSLSPNSPTPSIRHGTKAITTAAPTGSAASVLAANANRLRALIQNTGSVNVFLGVSGVTSSTGLLLVPGASLEDDASNDAWFAITASGTGALVILEVS
jgi:hypothetical protein